MKKKKELSNLVYDFILLMESKFVVSARYLSDVINKNLYFGCRLNL